MKREETYRQSQFDAYKQKQGFNDHKSCVSSDGIEIGNVLLFKPTGYFHAVWKIERTEINGEKWFNYESIVLDDSLLKKSGFEKDDFGLYYHPLMTYHHIKHVGTTYQLCQDAGLPIMGVFTYNKLQNVFKMITGIKLELL